MPKENKKREEPKVKDIPLHDNLAPEYANVLRVDHNQEEFQLMFVSVMGEVAKATAKVIMTPGHMKRIIEALQENVQMYEERFGLIQSRPRIAQSSVNDAVSEESPFEAGNKDGYDNEKGAEG